jgi:hypothetical protein
LKASTKGDPRGTPLDAVEAPLTIEELNPNYGYCPDFELILELRF